MKLRIKAINHPSGEIDMDQRTIAEAIELEISGSKVVSENRIALVTQDFTDRHVITVRFSGGQFLGFNEIADSALDEFESVK